MQHMDLDDQIRILCTKLDLPLITKLQREELMIELKVVLAKRELMLATLAKYNDYKGLDDSSTPDNED